MARHGRRRSGMRGRPASAFAPAEDRKGKGLQWESVLNLQTPQPITTQFPTVVRTVGSFQTRLATLIPANVTRGTVTMERVRGSVNIFFDPAELLADFANWSVFVTLQLVTVQSGAILPGAALSPRNAADQESNKIIWQRLYYPAVGATITGPGGLEFSPDNFAAIEVDIKVKRRFDRATWALALVIECETGAAVLHFMSGHLRGLFRASDGL